MFGVAVGLLRNNPKACGGQRLVSITFIESRIPNEFQRTQLYELGEIAALEGLTMSWEGRVRLDVVRNNLLRLWSLN